MKNVLDSWAKKPQLDESTITAELFLDENGRPKALKFPEWCMATAEDLLVWWEDAYSGVPASTLKKMEVPLSPVCATASEVQYVWIDSCNMHDTVEGT